MKAIRRITKCPIALLVVIIALGLSADIPEVYGKDSGSSIKIEKSAKAEKSVNQTKKHMSEGGAVKRGHSDHIGSSQEDAGIIITTIQPAQKKGQQEDAGIIIQNGRAAGQASLNNSTEMKMQGARPAGRINDHDSGSPYSGLMESIENSRGSEQEDAGIIIQTGHSDRQKGFQEDAGIIIQTGRSDHKKGFQEEAGIIIQNGRAVGRSGYIDGAGTMMQEGRPTGGDYDHPGYGPLD